MKKLIALMLCILMVATMSACSNNEVEETEAPTEIVTEAPTEAEAAGDTMTVEEIANVLYEGMDPNNMPMVGNMPVDAETFENYAFIPYIEGVEVIASEAMIGSIAHSAVVLRLPEGSDVDAVKADIEVNANPRKWVCVEAEKVVVTSHGNTILLVMSNVDMVDGIVANFDALWA